ncbi:MAG: hypothetical protein WCF16_03540 [Alphaproteobacteria bacterium]
MTPKFRVRLTPANAGRIAFFLVLYLIGLATLPATHQLRHEVAMAAACIADGAPHACAKTVLNLRG